MFRNRNAAGRRRRGPPLAREGDQSAADGFDFVLCGVKLLGAVGVFGHEASEVRGDEDIHEHLLELRHGD